LFRICSAVDASRRLWLASGARYGRHYAKTKEVILSKDVSTEANQSLSVADIKKAAISLKVIEEALKLPRGWGSVLETYDIKGFDPTSIIQHAERNQLHGEESSLRS
jgi:hypothetical protein